MPPPSFSSSSYVSMFVVSAAAAVLVRVTCLDSRYVGCEPRKCGELNISYPFWVVADDGVENSVCGYRGFDMRCINDQPIYRTSHAQYLIENVSYEENSFRVVDLQVIDSSCPKPTQNYSFDRSAVDFGPYHADLYLFYGCNKSSPLANVSTLIQLPCDHNAIYHSFVGLVVNDDLPDWPNTTRCESFVGAPVELEESQTNSTIKDVDYVGLLRAGFTLKWTGLYTADGAGEAAGDAVTTTRKRPAFASARTDRTLSTAMTVPMNSSWSIFGD